jgi:outer membrane protein TolC
MAAAEAEHAALTAEREGAETAARIDELIGRDPRLPLPPPPDPLAKVLPLPTLELLTHLAERRPAVVAARERERARAAEVARARGERLPEVALMLGYTSMEHRHDGDVFAGVSLSLPLDQGRRSAAVVEGAAALDEARAATRAVELSAMREAVDAHVHLGALAKAIVVREAAVAAARHAQAATQASLAAGAGGFAEALRAERALLGAELALAQDLAEYYMHLGHLECCIGVPFESIAVPAEGQP